MKIGIWTHIVTISISDNQEEEEEAEDEESDEEKEEDEEEKPANPLLVVVTEAVAEQVKEFVKKDHEGGSESRYSKLFAKVLNGTSRGS